MCSLDWTLSVGKKTIDKVNFRTLFAIFVSVIYNYESSVGRYLIVLNIYRVEHRQKLKLIL